VVSGYMLGSAMDAASAALGWVTQPQAHPGFQEALHGGHLAGDWADAVFEAGIDRLVANLAAVASAR
jgi:hypothetical protein